MRAFEPGQVGHERRVARRRPPADAGEHVGRIRHLRHPLRADERRHLDHRQAGRGQQIDERDLVRRGDRGGLVLQAVARADFDDGDRADGASWLRARSAPARPAPARRRGNSRRATVPSPGARTGSSIFIASSTIRMSPRWTRLTRADVDPGGRSPASAPSAIPQLAAPRRRRPGRSASNVKTLAVEEHPLRLARADGIRDGVAGPGRTALFARVGPPEPHRGIVQLRARSGPRRSR